MRRDQKGFSLIEVIIVIAMIGIFAGISVSMMGHIRYADTKKTVESVSSALEKQRINTMSKAGTPYLYIYKLSDGYYMKQVSDRSDNCITTFDSSVFTSDGLKIAGNNAEIYIDSETGTKVDSTSFIRIAFTKNGVFETAKVSETDSTERTNVSRIVIKGSGSYTITLVKATGKHIVE